ncbi:MAG: hypothetical protein AAGJ82_07320, partial [Bacteroidota bacterium]
QISEVTTLVIEEAISDKYEVRNVTHLIGERVRFSDVRTQNILGSADIYAINSKLRLGQLSAAFDDLRLQNRQGQLGLAVGQLPAYRLELMKDKDSKVSLPKSAELVTKGSAENVYTFGQGDEVTRLRINCSQCEIDIQE